jgi:hypothetical protein
VCVQIYIPLEGAFQEKMVCAQLTNQERRSNREQHAEARARLTDQEQQQERRNNREQHTEARARLTDQER